MLISNISTPSGITVENAEMVIQSVNIYKNRDCQYIALAYAPGFSVHFHEIRGEFKYKGGDVLDEAESHLSGVVN
ncbi:hypothetical protein NVP1106O_52 [Vibrio phage 1.106.O._10N.286.51.F7]|nr:hypothetical protein NVP1106O_52 [Vibrio phage 1.106.O._10N.286.51.F7]